MSLKLYIEQSGTAAALVNQHNTNASAHNNIAAEVAGKAPKDHASADEIYGKGTNTNYGHLKLTDSITDSTLSTSYGTAATPKAISDVNTKASTALSGSLNRYTHSKEGTVHTLTKIATNDSTTIKFTATASYSKGDTFVVDGVCYTDLETMSGGHLYTNAFVTGSQVLCFKTNNALFFTNSDSSKAMINKMTATKTGTVYYLTGELTGPYINFSIPTPLNAGDTFQLVGSSKNLLQNQSSYTYASGLSNLVVDYDFYDRSTTFTGSNIESGSTFTICENFQLPANTYTLSIQDPLITTGISLALYVRDSSTPNVSLSGTTTSASFVLESDSQVSVAFVYGDNTTFSCNIKPQIEVGSVATEYEPAPLTLHPELPNGNDIYEGGLAGFSNVFAIISGTSLDICISSSRFWYSSESLPASGWVGTAAPYTQALSILGVVSSDTPHIGPLYSSTIATALLQKAAWSCISNATTSTNTITFSCWEDKPTEDITIQIEIIR